MIFNETKLELEGCLENLSIGWNEGKFYKMLCYLKTSKFDLINKFMEEEVRKNQIYCIGDNSGCEL